MEQNAKPLPCVSGGVEAKQTQICVDQKVQEPTGSGLGETSNVSAGTRAGARPSSHKGWWGDEPITPRERSASAESPVAHKVAVEGGITKVNCKNASQKEPNDTGAWGQGAGLTTLRKAGIIEGVGTSRTDHYDINLVEAKIGASPSDVDDTPLLDVLHRYITGRLRGPTVRNCQAARWDRDRNPICRKGI